MASSLCEKCEELFNCDFYEVRGDGPSAFRRPNSFTDWYFVCHIESGDLGPPIPKELLRRIVGFALNGSTVGATAIEDELPSFSWVPEDISLRKTLPHHTKKGLAVSANQGCGLCKTLISDVRVDNFDGEDEHEDIQSIVLFSSQYDPGIKQLGRPCGVGDFGCLTLHLLFLNKDYSSLRALYSSKIWDNYEDANKRSKRRSRDLEIAQTFQCQNWLLECLSKHTECNKVLVGACSSENVYPTRLLKLSKTDEEISVKLVDTFATGISVKRPSYATLSYRWGGVVPLKLLESNLEDFQNNIPFSELSRLFQDVVDVVLSLGIKFLWIDALCIIQDSEIDFAVEAPRMAAIYSDCLINIAATSSKNSDSGLFNEIQHPAWKAIRCKSTIFSLPPHYPLIDFRSMVDLAPINRRGWVLQERSLAPRILHFATDRLWWDCREIVNHEDGSYEDRLETDETKTLDLLELRHWTSLVQRYSRTDLTRESDRLIAFAGLVEVYRSAHQYDANDYLAGLWRPHLLEHLLWYVMNKHEVRREGKTDGDPYVVGPTWSWASVNARMTFVWIDKRYTCTWHPNFMVINAGVVRQSASPFGKIDSGTLEVECLLHPIIIETGESPEDSPVMQISDSTYHHLDKDKEREYERKIELGEESEKVDGITNFDIHIDNGMSAKDVKKLSAFFTPVLRRESKKKGYFKDQIWGLILLPTSQEADGKIFQRIGLLFIYCLTGFSDMPSWWKQGSSDAYEDGHERIRIV